jgi:hypothetical protein
MKGWRLIVVCAAAIVAICGFAEAQVFDGGVPPTWTCEGYCGAMGADGVVTLAPGGGTQYGYVVSAADSPTGLALPGVGGTGNPDTGSRLRTSAFVADAGEELRFLFNFVTSDGAGYADYAWARLLDGSLNEVALLFTARTTTGGSTVPGFSMPPVAATITPATVNIIDGGPTWSPLASYSGMCYDTGILEFGVVNWDDSSYDTGMAIDGLTVGGAPPVAESIADIPTLSGWGVVLMVSLLTLLGTALIWRSRT